MNHSIIQAAQNDGVMIALSGQGNIKARGEPEQVQKWLPLIREHKQTIIDYLTHLWVNKYCDEQMFEQFGNQMAMEQGLGRVHKLYRKALKIGISDGQSWDFGEGVAVLEFSGDNRRACLECDHYQHSKGTNYGRCSRAGELPLQHMMRGASVNWDWLNRCQKNSARNPATTAI